MAHFGVSTYKRTEFSMGTQKARGMDRAAKWSRGWRRFLIDLGLAIGILKQTPPPPPKPSLPDEAVSAVSPPPPQERVWNSCRMPGCYNIIPPIGFHQAHFISIGGKYLAICQECVRKLLEA